MNVFLIYKDLNIESSYYELCKRIDNKNNDILERFILLFLKDKSYTNLILAYEQNDYHKMYFHAHTLKGMTLNLGFFSINELLNKLCINLKHKEINNTNINKLIHQIKQSYIKIINTINKYNKKYVAI